MTVSCIAFETLVQTYTQLEVRVIFREDQENVSIAPCRLNGFTGSNFTLERRLKYVKFAKDVLYTNALNIYKYFTSIKCCINVV